MKFTKPNCFHRVKNVALGNFLSESDAVTLQRRGREESIRKIIQILLIIFITVPGLIRGQTAKDFESWKRNDRNRKIKFIAKDDAKFAEFLTRDWKEYRLFQSVKPDTVPKPSTIPIKEKNDRIRNDLSKTPKIHKQVNIPVENTSPPKHEVARYSHDLPTIDLAFYGQTYRLPNQKKFHLGSRNRIDNRYISQAWQQFSQAGYKEVTEELQTISKELALNDWGYVVLLNDYSDVLFGKDTNNKYLFMWYILLHSGYDAKVGYSNNNIVLMLSTKYDIYGTRYLPLNNSGKYFIYPFDSAEQPVSNIYTYDNNYQDNLKKVDLAFNSPHLSIERFEKKLHFQYGNASIAVNVNTNLNLIRYLNRVPQTELKIYFRHEPDNGLRKSITRSLQGYIIGKSEGEAANLLLRFVQKSQGYETDEQQFKKENYLFPEETIYYQYSDCEDRAILYAYLVRDMLGLEVIGLDYPGHIATGVNFTSRITGDAVRYQNKRYLICDPTYINADIGQCMPNFKQVSPQIIIF